MKDPHAVALGRKGGAAGRGDSKARDPKKMRLAGKKGAEARWGTPGAKRKKAASK